MQGCVKDFIKHHHDHYEGCGHDQDPSADKEGTVKFSRNQMIVRFADSFDLEDKKRLRGTDPDSEFVLESEPETCNCGDSSIEIWTIDTTATGVAIEAARDNLNRGTRGSEVKGDIEFEITIPIDVPKPGQSDNPQSSPSGGDDVLIAVIDTGLDHSYDDSDGYVLDTGEIVCPDSFNGWNFVEENDNATDTHGHGTYVTKIIRNILEPQAIGFKILPLKAFDGSGKGSYSNIICAMSYLKKFEASGTNIDIVNASFGGTLPVADFETLTLLPELIEELGDDTIIIASAGNEETEVDNGDLRHFPSGFDSANLLTVGGYAVGTETLEIHPESNRGNSSIDMATLFEPYDLQFSRGGSITMVDDLAGTSYGTAYVSGIAAQEKGNNRGIVDLKGHVLNLTNSVENLTDFVMEGRALEQPLTP